MDLVNPNYWAGNLTVGSPLRGGQIAISSQNGVAQQFIQQGIVELLRGPSVGSTALFIISPTIGVLLVAVGVFGTAFSNTIAGLVVDAIIDNFGTTPQTANDLNPNGGYMQSIDIQGNTGSPKINVWGNEDYPVLWRVAGSYSGGTDQAGVDGMNTAAGVYHTAADIEYIASWTPPFILFHGYWVWRGNQWMAGADWLRHTSNQGWQAVIGAGFVQNQWVQVLEYSQDCYDEMQWCADPQNAGQCDESQCMQWIWVELPVFNVDQSDGVVPARSARNDGGTWRGHIVEAPGINHKELLQFNPAHTIYDGIFNGTDTANQPVFTIGF